MCQLLGMNANSPMELSFSFDGFRARGGLTDHHADGWGIAFFEGKSARVFLDEQPSAYSVLAAIMRQYPIHSTNVIAHIRKATQGRVGLENTHPFQRELWGRHWVFAHNGNLQDFRPALDGCFIPVGDTDSERAFCWLMQQLRRTHATKPDNAMIYATLKMLCARISSHGEFNCLLSNGEVLFAHSSKSLYYVARQAPFAVAHLSDKDVSMDFSKTNATHERLTVIATKPVTDNEPWIFIEPGTLMMFQDGLPVHTGTCQIAC